MRAQCKEYQFSSKGGLLAASSCCCLKVERLCGHSTDYNCKQLVQLLKQQEMRGKCAKMVEKPLRCGHMAVAPCRKFQDYQDGKAAIPCKEKRETECWNVAVCKSRRLMVDCAETRQVCCDKAVTWTCQKSAHSFSLKVCKEGEPSECPSCSDDSLSAAMEETRRCMEEDSTKPLADLSIYTSLQRIAEDRSWCLAPELFCVKQAVFERSSL